MDIPDDLRDLEKLREFLKAFKKRERESFVDEAIKKNKGLSDNYPTIDDVCRFMEWAKNKRLSREATLFKNSSKEKTPLSEDVRKIVYYYACAYGYTKKKNENRAVKYPFFVLLDQESLEIVKNFVKNNKVSKNKAVETLIKKAARFIY